MIPAEIRGILRPYMEQAPTDLNGAAQALGLDIYSTDLADSVSGVLVRDESYNTSSGFVIYVDESEPSVRQRFTAAHEIGHYVLHRDLIGDRLEDNYLLRSAGLSNRQEVEANKFAADLLMPREVISMEMDRGGATVQSLAQRFGVSEVAMSIRLGLAT